jgi:uncharacterized delta-60 repeat protein
MKKVLILISLILTFLTKLNAQSGALDPYFDSDGKVITNINNGWDEVFAMALQKDERIVTVGSSLINGNHDFALARYNSDGSLDKSFDNDGKLTLAFGDSTDKLTSVAIQQNGNIVVAGYTYNGKDKDFAMARFNPDGSLDKTFSNDGKLTTSFGTAQEEEAHSVTLQADGKILVAGYTGVHPNYDFAVVRYNEDGTPDITFDIDGRVTTSAGGAWSWANAMLLQPDGKIVLTGYSYLNTRKHISIVRYNKNGSLDNGFGSNGIVTTKVGTDDEGKSILLQKDGRLIVGANSRSGFLDFALVRYKSNGTIDSTFGAEGKVITHFDSEQQAVLGSIMLQSDGKILAGGHKSFEDRSDFLLIRYNQDGSLDGNFGIGGIVITDIEEDRGYCMVWQPDGKIILAGSSHVKPQQTSNFALVRYLSGINLTINNSKVTDNTVLMYPNPTNDKVIFELNLINIQQVSLDIIDIDGKLIYHFLSIDPDSKTIIDLENHSNDIYFYKLYSNNGYSKTGKIILTH